MINHGRIAIIGGGMGGLAAAIALKKIAGIEATVFEQARKNNEVGAGLTVAPNGARVLDHLGILEPVQREGATPEGQGVYLDGKGNLVSEAAWEDSSRQYQNIDMYRPDLVDVLTREAGPDRIRFGHRLKSIEPRGAGVHVAFENGVQEDFDAVIGADGKHSVVRDSAIHRSELVYSGYIAYRGVLDASLLPPNWPKISQVWMANERHFMFYPLQRGAKIYNFIGFVPSRKPLEGTRPLSGPAEVSELAAEFAGGDWDPRLHGVIDKIDHTFWWAMSDHDPLPIWTRGPIALLGDAAHTMLPHQGQGVNMAFEDCLALAFFLREANGVRDIPVAFKRYAAVRMQRATILQVGSRRAGAMFDAQHQFKDLKKRDSDIHAGRDFRRRAVFDYDVLKVSENALKRFKRS
ncbi:MAG TPA: NAD(P)/FAD-dependent oxidoreductase [Nevskiaceae bacterium]